MSSPLQTQRQEHVTLTTLQLLEEVQSYLERLAPVPTTHALISKINAHLRDPGVAAAQRDAQEQCLINSRRFGAVFADNGLATLEVLVEGQTARVTTRRPTGKAPNAWAEERATVPLSIRAPDPKLSAPPKN